MSKHMLLVLSNATDGEDETFNDWYTNTHLGDVLSIPGYTAAQRFCLSKTQLGDAASIPYQYLAIYEVETDDLPAAAKALTRTQLYISPALDRDRTAAWFYTPTTDRVARA